MNTDEKMSSSLFLQLLMNHLPKLSQDLVFSLQPLLLAEIKHIEFITIKKCGTQSLEIVNFVLT